MTKAERLICENIETKSSYLDLGNCGLDGTEPELALLEECTWLETLILSNGWQEYDGDEQRSRKSRNTGKPNLLACLPSRLPPNLIKLVASGTYERRFGIRSLASLLALSRLTYLDLSNNELMRLKDLSGLSRLTYLNLSSNRLMRLEGLEGLSSLTCLCLGSNYLMGLEGLPDLPCLTELYLSDNRLTQLKGLSSLPRLTKLFLKFNQLTRLEGLEGLSNLAELFLEGNKLTCVKGLSSLPSLTRLDLNRNELTRIEGLEGLSNLTYLDLGWNQITRLEGLEGLSSLIELNLNFNRVTRIESLEGLSSLNNLWITKNRLTRIEGLEGLSNLTDLDLGGNQITRIEGLEGLSNLTKLCLYDNQITRIEGLECLPNLLTLNLSSNQITHIEGLEGLSNLTELCLYDNQIARIEGLSGLANLTELELTSNELTHIEGLSGLSNLTTLRIRHNQLTCIGGLSGLSSLTELELASNQITRIEGLSGLSCLTKLDLGSNQIERIEGLEELVSLTELHLNENQITRIEGLEGLESLTELYLHDNQIVRLEGLAGLTLLSLSNNRILEIDLAFLNKLPLSKGLYLSGNPFLHIPQEIFAEYDCLPKLRRYLEDCEAGKTQNKEVKVILIGNGSVGKTQIARRWVGKDFVEEHESTHGIVILRKEMHGVMSNIWDFAGQDIYHATHRLFMETNALFVLVWDFENENKPFHTWKNAPYRNEKIAYWLAYAHFFGKNSPVLILQNKVDLPDAQPFQSEDKEAYQAQYPIINFLQVSAKTGEGFAELSSCLARTFQENEVLQKYLRQELPISWIAVRNEIRLLQQEGVKEMLESDFQALCAKQGVPHSAKEVLEYFHDTGALYYRSGHFGGRIILDQAWAIEAVYKVLDRNDAYIAENIGGDGAGKLTYEHICKIWQEEGDDVREFFIRFIRGAELIFEITDGSSTPFQERVFVIPHLLTESKPLEVAHEQQARQLNQIMEISYLFLPVVFMQRFIVRASHLAETSAHIWRHGILLSTQKGSALVEANYEKGNICIATDNTDIVEIIKEELDIITNKISVLLEDRCSVGLWKLYRPH